MNIELDANEKKKLLAKANKLKIDGVEFRDVKGAQWDVSGFERYYIAYCHHCEREFIRDVDGQLKNKFKCYHCLLKENRARLKKVDG